ncbi:MULTISPECIES: hypothetical protein [Brevibacillus]|uniref:hypothetical protein n=1 Tax=Brevibacillus TaxID=55080 RepID=UPI00247630A7|nr:MULTISPECIES: hypothetical protein [Brevibacillus]MDH6348479.1 hypothetical protein [Brevibacillus sp. 1238]
MREVDNPFSWMRCMTQPTSRKTLIMVSILPCHGGSADDANYKESAQASFYAFSFFLETPDRHA